jgi:hypothetical protein
MQAKEGFKRFLAKHEGKHFCACGCGGVIKIDYKRYTDNSRNIPKYILGHNSRGSNHPMYNAEIDEWVKLHTNKHLCKCGCGEFIEIERRYYYTQTIPEYIHNHHSRGADHYMWMGGVSFGEYCPKFNNTIKRYIREKYNNCDFISGLPDTICNNGRKLDVHHVDYNKQQGCDDHEWQLIPLSVSNHGKANHNRPFWNRLFTYALQYWMNITEVLKSHHTTSMISMMCKFSGVRLALIDGFTSFSIPHLLRSSGRSTERYCMIPLLLKQLDSSLEILLPS